MNQYKPIQMEGFVSTSTKLNFLLFVLKCLLSYLKGLHLFHVVSRTFFYLFRPESKHSHSIHTAAPSTHPLVAWTALLWFFFRFLRSFLKCSKQNCTGYSSCSLVLNKRRMFVSLVFFILLCGIQDFVSWTGCSSLLGQNFKNNTIGPGLFPGF